MRPSQRTTKSTKQIVASELALRESADRKERTRQLWQSLNSFVFERGGQIRSKPDAFPAQLEVHPESELPKKLEELGWTLVNRGTITRIGPPEARWNASPFRQMDVYDICLPQPRPVTG
jgi:hypothetical protein